MQNKEKKILLWFEDISFYFGISKKIQEKSDHKLYAIVDGNIESEKYYNAQTLVKFDKIWSFRNEINVTKKTFDLSYLTSFESKYGIKIWDIVYSERFFSNFSRYHSFSYEEVLSIVEQECRFFEKILNEINPDYFIIRVPDFHNVHLLHKLCLAKNIEPIILDYTRFGSKSILTNEVDMPISFSSEIQQNQLKSFEELQEIFHKKNSLISYNKKLRSSKLQMIKTAFHFIFKTSSYDKSYQTIGKTKSNVLFKELAKLVRKYFRGRFLTKNSLSSVPDYPYIFFPLHLEPERTLLMKAPFYTNQLSLIENIAKSIPVGYKLLVKEHPAMQRSGWRSISFYKQLLRLANVELIHPSTNNEKLFKNCSLVVTIAGTAGIESNLYEKPSIVFADVIYSKLSSVERITNLEDLPFQIEKSLKKPVKIEELNLYLQKLDSLSYNYDAFNLSLEFDETFNFSGYLSGTTTSFNQFEKFLELKNDILETVSTEILKKISEN